MKKLNIGAAAASVPMDDSCQLVMINNQLQIQAIGPGNLRISQVPSFKSNSKECFVWKTNPLIKLCEKMQYDWMIHGW